jgi:hypothetical protein
LNWNCEFFGVGVPGDGYALGGRAGLNEQCEAVLAEKVRLRHADWRELAKENVRWLQCAEEP